MCRNSKHHIWWPRRRYRGQPVRKAVVRVSQSVHDAYHSFWFKNCRDFPDKRPCHKHWCRYGFMCCYEKTLDTF